MLTEPVPLEPFRLYSFTYDYRKTRRSHLVPACFFENFFRFHATNTDHITPIQVKPFVIKFVNGKKSKSYLPEDWRNYFGTPVDEHEDSYKINLADGYITTNKT